MSNMIKIILCTILMYSPLAWSKVYLELGLGNNTNLTGSSTPWNDGGGTGGFFSFNYETLLYKRTYVIYHWSHYSQLQVGPPFNDDDESSLDHFGIKLRFLL
tara:strand:+ start:166 stop:471 length:306 start_codon:yes stop_codon:yes gene_type:complete